jgi:hypothetical protein
MANDLTTALLSGNAANMAAADPATLAIIPQLTLAQTLSQQALSGAPAYPAQALGRLASALAGVQMTNDATGQLQDLYKNGVEAASRSLPPDHPLQKFLKSDDPYTRSIGMRNLDKAIIQQGGAYSEGYGAQQKSPYESGGTGTIPGGPSGTQEVPITAEERARAAAGRGAPVPSAVLNRQPPAGTVNPHVIGGQPQNLTGPVIPPGGFNAPHAPAPEAPKPAAPRPAPDATPAAATLGGKPVNTPEYAGETKGREELYGAANKAIGGVIAEHIEAGGQQARQKMNALDTIESSLRTNEGKGIVTGPHAESILRMRETLDAMGIKTDWVKTGMAQSEMIQKMNAQLAAASAKAMTGRPTQFEFQAWQKNNPGLATSKEGSLALLDVNRQIARQDIELGRLAQDKKNWDNWPATVDKFYQTHDLINPMTGKPMRADIEAARGGGAPGSPAARGAPGSPAPGSFNDRWEGAGSAVGAKPPVKVSSPAEARKLPSGTAIILPDGTPGRVP